MTSVRTASCYNSAGYFLGDLVRALRTSKNVGRHPSVTTSFVRTNCGVYIAARINLPEMETHWPLFGCKYLFLEPNWTEGAVASRCERLPPWW